MNEDAQTIFEFLPIRKNTIEVEYIEHLWNAFLRLDTSENNAQAFTLMPFHLLFMLAIQYKVLRITKTHPEHTDLFFASVGGQDREILLNSTKSVFDLGLVRESTIQEIFRLVNLGPESIKKIKDMVKNRNDKLAHAKGSIEQNPEVRIQEYLNALREIQDCFELINDGIADEWDTKLTPDDVLEEFVEFNLTDSYLCPADFVKSKLTKYALIKDLEINVSN